MRFPVTILLVVLAAVLFFVLRDDDEESGGNGELTTQTGTATTAITNGGGTQVIQVKGGEAVGGLRELTTTQGNPVSFEIRSDEKTEVHLHGYDITKNIPAGGSASFDFIADLDGIYEVELHPQHTTIAELTVQP